ncbi:MAG: flavodoxin-dependent (E)-4-hydroxy-3-methylbut-2-enyl-diphosphate synthase [Clostridia bacterium]|nr:flavodoxin-dependent (E)-4-hydroxy-3-methylbut-2-enyl-diphosphate synthase [Clostridia bacterium]
MERKITRTVKAGNVLIGGGNPIPVQSMTNTPAENFEATVAQMLSLQKSGCEIIRAAAPNEAAAEVFAHAKKAGVAIPMVADIHFDYKIALAALRAGADKIRINPGNIGERWKVEEVAKACKAAGVPIRIGVNGGSLEKGLLQKYGGPTAEALSESALTQADMLESFGFTDTVISIKSSHIDRMIKACQLVSEQSDYPIHLGVTEAGDEYSGLIKNSIGIGSVLSQGIGDTLRVSLTADPKREVMAGKEILASLGLRNGGIDIISCPTCGRTKIDLISLSKQFREAIEGIDTKGKKITCAIMGCVVNGPGEAREADFGIAGGDGCAMLFRHGETVCKIDENDIIPALLREIDRMINE